jgi:chorismate dehydratase
MSQVRLGAVGYLNARPLVYGLGRSPGFSLRFDVPSECAALLHAGAIDLGLIPSIEYLRGAAEGYCIVPDLAIASRGPVDSVALYTRRSMADVRSIAADTGSRTSVALATILCARAFRVRPRIHPEAPNLEAMLDRADAALIIGDSALFQGVGNGRHPVDAARDIEKIDLGELWTKTTGLSFVYAFWAGRTGALSDAHVRELRAARDAGVGRAREIAQEYLPGSEERQRIAVRYLQDNIKYVLGPEELAGLELFYAYAAELGLVQSARPLRFYEGRLSGQA